MLKIPFIHGLECVCPRVFLVPRKGVFIAEIDQTKVDIRSISEAEAKCVFRVRRTKFPEA